MPEPQASAPEISMLPLPDMNVESQWDELEDEDEPYEEEFTFDDNPPEQQVTGETTPQEAPAPVSEPVGEAPAEGPVESPPVPAAAPSASRTFEETMEIELLRLINRERERSGIQVLGLEDSLHWASRIRAPEVMESLSHTRPIGSPYYTAFDEAGFAYAGKWHGENVTTMSFSPDAYTAESAAAKMFDALTASPGHYQNMLSSNYHQAGIGVYVEERDGSVFISSAQMFSSF